MNILRVLISSFCSVALATAASAETTIMPIGDSITRGCCEQGVDCEIGYRRPLYIKLVRAGYFVDFVGSEENPRSLCGILGIPIDFDRHHEGINGRKAEALKNVIYGYLTTRPADVVLLHIGLMDLFRGNKTPSEAVTEVMNVLDKIDAYEAQSGRKVTVVLARILNADPTTTTITQFNVELAQRAQDRIANGDKIIIVDMENGAGIDYNVDMGDAWHPNVNGYAKMANVWYSALQQTLPPLSNWTPRPLGNHSDLFGITYAAGFAITVGKTGTAFATSDGAVWTNSSLNTIVDLNDVAHGNGTFVAVGLKFFTSVDGVSWVTRNPGVNEKFRGIAFGNDRFVAVGSNGTVVTSNDGASWGLRSSGTQKSLWGVAYGNGTFVVVGRDGTILTSSNDGSSWTHRTSGTTEVLGAATYGNGTFVVVGNRGTILTSPDGVTWTQRSSATNHALYAVAYGYNTYVAVGYGGIILSSHDAAQWTQRISGTNDRTKNLLDVAYVDGTFVSVGLSGRILQSVPLRRRNPIGRLCESACRHFNFCCPPPVWRARENVHRPINDP